MNVTKKLSCVTAALLSTVVFSAPAFSAEVMLGTSVYNKQMHKLEMMKMLDADGNHKMTKMSLSIFIRQFSSRWINLVMSSWIPKSG